MFICLDCPTLYNLLDFVKIYGKMYKREKLKNTTYKKI